MTVDVRHYSVLVSDGQRSGCIIMCFAEWPPGTFRTHWPHTQGLQCAWLDALCCAFHPEPISWLPICTFQPLTFIAQHPQLPASLAITSLTSISILFVYFAL